MSEDPQSLGPRMHLACYHAWHARRNFLTGFRVEGLSLTGSMLVHVQPDNPEPQNWALRYLITICNPKLRSPDAETYAGAAKGIPTHRVQLS